MTATLVIAAAATSPLAPALLVVLIRLGLTLPAVRRDALGASYVAAELDDYSWRAEQATIARALGDGHDDLVRARTQAFEDSRISRAHRVLFRHPADGPAQPGVAVVAQWWQPIGRPPMTARRTPGATLIGAAAA